MFELKQKNEKELESALSDKRKKLKDLDRALRDVDMDSNVLSVSTTCIQIIGQLENNNPPLNYVVHASRIRCICSRTNLISLL